MREAGINHREIREIGEIGIRINHKEIREIEEIGDHARMIDAPQ